MRGEILIVSDPTFFFKQWLTWLDVWLENETSWDFSLGIGPAHYSVALVDFVIWLEWGKLDWMD